MLFGHVALLHVFFGKNIPSGFHIALGSSFLSQIRFLRYIGEQSIIAVLDERLFPVISLEDIWENPAVVQKYNGLSATWPKIFSRREGRNSFKVFQLSSETLFSHGRLDCTW